MESQLKSLGATKEQTKMMVCYDKGMATLVKKKRVHVHQQRAMVMMV